MQSDKYSWVLSYPAYLHKCMVELIEKKGYKLSPAAVGGPDSTTPPDKRMFLFMANIKYPKYFPDNEVWFQEELNFEYSCKIYGPDDAIRIPDFVEKPEIPKEYWHIVVNRHDIKGFLEALKKYGYNDGYCKSENFNVSDQWFVYNYSPNSKSNGEFRNIFVCPVHPKSDKHILPWINDLLVTKSFTGIYNTYFKEMARF